MRPLPQPQQQPLAVEVIPPEHAPILGTRTCLWRDESDCADTAATLAARPSLHDAFIELHGPLGAGKTTFARHLLRALGVTGRIKSPSYAVLEPHQVGPLAISHFDFYRFDDPREWADAGLRELFAAPGLKLVEWPEKAAGQLPRPDLRVLIEPLDDDARRVTMQALSARGQSLLPA
jgi:tRNA threonylcarbamoyladenosine biosynthesis protein TsaE